MTRKYPRSESRARSKAAKKARPDERKLLVWFADSPLLGPTVFVPGYVLPSLANARLHWRALATIKQRQKDLGWRMGRMMIAHSKTVAPPKCVMLRRVGKRLLDCDNLASAFKHVRDGIAVAYNVDDGPAGPIVWRYAQETGKEPGIDVRWTR